MRTRNGFSLVEVLLYTALIGTVMVGAAWLAYGSFSVRGRLRAAMILEENLRFASLQIQSAINDAASVTTPAIPGTSSTLVLATSVTSTNPSTFSLSSGSLLFAQGTGTAASLTSNEVTVSSVSFHRASSTPPAIQFAITGSINGAPASYGTMTVTTTAVLHR